MMHRFVRQRGGTFLGLVLGLVAGLALALGVAVYITKVPVPFVNKGTTRNGEQDAVEAKKNKDWDPNAMMQGKNPVRAASGPVSKALEPADADSRKAAVKPAASPGIAAEEKASPKADTKAESKPEAKSSVDPLGDLARAKASSVPAELFTYMVQTGAFRGPDDAEAQRAKLTLMGIDVKVTEREQAGRTVFRVRAGPFERKEAAEQTKEKLESAGYEAVMVRIQR
ncbi:MAG: hypothetical protein RLZZ401_1585 [Pseudomonadota bacterium]|jgi:cell division protein FtsN